MAEQPTEERRQELIGFLPEDLRKRVEEGELQVFEGQKPEKPVLIDDKGRLVKGSGRYPNANDPAKIGRQYGYKNSKDYQDAMRKLIPIDGDVDQKGSFAWLVTQGFDAAEGSPQNIRCPNCDYKGLVAFKKDSNAIIKLIEMVHGRARESQDINVKSEQLIGILDTRIPLDQLAVHSLTEEEIQERKNIVLEGND